MTDTFDSVPRDLSPTFPASRRHAHYAAQLVAAAGQTLLAPDPEFHFSGATFEAARYAVVGSPLPGGRRVSLTLDDLMLEVTGVGAEVLELAGRPIPEAARWLGGVLGAELVFPAWDLPEGPVKDFGRLSPEPADLDALARWYAAADETLRRLTVDVGAKGEVRLWPHHFDLATLVTLDSDEKDPERSRTVGLGFSPGDPSIPLPYLYATPWPPPPDRRTPLLPVGRWQTEGWYGAVVDTYAIDDQHTAEEFFRSALRWFSGLAT